MARIGVEDSLGQVKQQLQSSGHEVVSMEDKNCDCYVISGQDRNMMGIAEAVTSASVINAEGLTADEIVQQVNQRV